MYKIVLQYITVELKASGFGLLVRQKMKKTTLWTRGTFNGTIVFYALTLYRLSTRGRKLNLTVCIINIINRIENQKKTC